MLSQKSPCAGSVPAPTELWTAGLQRRSALGASPWASSFQWKLSCHSSLVHSCRQCQGPAFESSQDSASQQSTRAACSGVLLGTDRHTNRISWCINLPVCWAGDAGWSVFPPLFMITSVLYFVFLFASFHAPAASCPFCLSFQCLLLQSLFSKCMFVTSVSLPQRVVWRRSGGKELTWTLPGWSGQKYFLICRTSGSQLSARRQKYWPRDNVTPLDRRDLWLTKLHTYSVMSWLPTAFGSFSEIESFV